MPLGSELFAEDCVAWACLREQPPQLDLDGTIGLGHGREVGLGLDREAGSKARERDRVRSVGERECKLEVGAHGPGP